MREALPHPTMLHTYTPDDFNGLLVVADSRMKADVLTQEQEGGRPVLENYGFFNAALGKKNWAQTARVAMYDFREDVSKLSPENAQRVSEAPNEKKRRSLEKTLLAGQRASKRAELLRFIKDLNPRAVIVLQSLSTKAANKSKDGEDTLQNSSGTLCWDTFGAPDSFAEMAGCAWDSHGLGFGPIVPLPNPANNEYVYGYLYRRWARMGLDLAGGRLAPREAPVKIIQPGPEMLAALRAMHTHGRPIAVDIEAISKLDVITEIGVADGHYAISIPWEAYVPYLGTELLEGCVGTEIGREVVALLESGCVKILQNHSFDLPFLKKHGISLNSPIVDTMALHKAVPPYSQYRRGLQKIASQLMCTRPWKSLWHPKVPGLTKDDAEYWTAGDPLGRRSYNADDSDRTYVIAKELGWRCGVKI